MSKNEIEIDGVIYITKDTQAWTPVGDNEIKLNGEIWVRKSSLKKKSKNILECVNSFEDACGVLDEDYNTKKYHEGETDEIAYCRMKIICKALRDGNVLRFSDHNQKKWYTWSICEEGGSGFRFFDSYYDYADTCSGGGSRLYVDTEEKAVYVAKHPEFSKYLDDLNPVVID